MDSKDNAPNQPRALAWQGVERAFLELPALPSVFLLAVLAEQSADYHAWRVHFEKQTPLHELTKAVWSSTEKTPESRGTVYVAGDLGNVEAFTALAERAGELSKSAPVELVPDAIRRMDSYLSHWLWLLFEIAWQKIDSVPLRADQLVPSPAGGSWLIDFARANGKYDGWCYSEIKDAVAASRDVIRLIQSYERAEAIKVEIRKRGMPLALASDRPNDVCMVLELLASRDHFRLHEVLDYIGEDMLRVLDQKGWIEFRTSRLESMATRHDTSNNGLVVRVGNWHSATRQQGNFAEIGKSQIISLIRKSREEAPRIRPDIMLTEEGRAALGEMRITPPTRSSNESELAMPVSSTKKFTMAALRDLTGLQNKAINGYAKEAGVRIAERGGRHFRYATAEVIQILISVRDSTTEDDVRSRCKAALEDIQKTVK